MNKELEHIVKNNFKVGDKVNWEFISGREFTIIEINEYKSPSGVIFYNIRLENNDKSFEATPFEITHTKSHIREEKLNNLLNDGYIQKNS